jgi:hypothetical protein
MRRVSFFKILYHDYAAFGTFSGMFIGIIALIYGLWMKDQVAQIIGGGLIVVLGTLFLYRLIIILRLFREGEEVKGVIINKWYYRDRGRIDYRYAVQGEIVTSGWAIMRNKVNRQLEKDMEVTILINPHKPKQSIILSVFEVK